MGMFKCTACDGIADSQDGSSMCCSQCNGMYCGGCAEEHFREYDSKLCIKCEIDKKEALREDNEEWRREQAQEAGMLHGIDAYNDIITQPLPGDDK